MKILETISVALCCAVLATGLARAADDFPTKPIRMIVPVPAGSGLDVRTRYLTQMAAQHLGWNMVIDNKPGAGQSIGTAAAARSAPDGYTLLVVNNNITINPYLQLNPGYDPFKSLVPITATIQAPLVLVVNVDSGIKTVKELVAYANSKPEGLTYAHSGLGSTPFFTAELFKKITGIKALEVPFKGDSEWLPQLMGGRVDFGFSGPPSVGPLIAAGKVRPLGVTTKVRAFSLPDVPSIAEAGYPAYDYPVYVGVFAPAGTPKAIIDKLNAGFRRIVQMPEFQKATRATGGEPLGTLPEEFAAMVRADDKQTGEIVKALGLKPE